MDGDISADFCYIKETSAENEEFAEFFLKIASKLADQGLETKHVVQVSLHIDMERFA